MVNIRTVLVEFRKSPHLAAHIFLNAPSISFQSQRRKTSLTRISPSHRHTLPPPPPSHCCPICVAFHPSQSTRVSERWGHPEAILRSQLWSCGCLVDLSMDTFECVRHPCNPYLVGASLIDLVPTLLNALFTSNKYIILGYIAYSANYLEKYDYCGFIFEIGMLRFAKRRLLHD